MANSLAMLLTNNEIQSTYIVELVDVRNMGVCNHDIWQSLHITKTMRQSGWQFIADIIRGVDQAALGESSPKEHQLFQGYWPSLFLNPSRVLSVGVMVWLEAGAYSSRMTAGRHGGGAVVKLRVLHGRKLRASGVLRGHLWSISRLPYGRRRRLYENAGGGCRGACWRAGLGCCQVAPLSRAATMFLERSSRIVA